mmetsp:Transcript_18161/g.62880  ORF Transcript_18161/g.62880 Transcript_18161/m.62880 type:complete len:225 (-) Transcript_18161:627-1301(-)
MLDSTADVLAAAVLRTEWKDDASAEDEGRSRKHLSRLARRVASFHWGNLPVARRPRTLSRNRRRARAPDASRRRPRAPARAGRRRSPTRAAPRRTSSSRRRSSRTGPRRAAARARSPRNRRAPTAAASPRAVAHPVRRAPAQDGHGPRLARDGRERRDVLHRRRGDAQARAQAGPAPARRPASFERARRASTSSLPNDFDRRRARGPPCHGPLELPRPVRVHPR